MFLATMSFVCTTHATNVKLDYFEFNDAAGTTFGTTAFAGWANTGVLDSRWNFGDVKQNPGGTTGTASAFTTDGSGNMILTGLQGQTFRKLGAGTTGAYTTPLGASTLLGGAATGIYRFELNLASWSLAANGPNGNSFQAILTSAAEGGTDIAGIRLKLNDGASRIQMFTDSTETGAQNNFHNVDFAALTGNPAQNLAIELDYNTGGIEYIVNGETVRNFTNFAKVDIGSFQLSTSGGSGFWSPDNTVSVNSMGLSMVPEPSTGSMILLGMGGLAAVRLLRRKVS